MEKKIIILIVTLFFVCPLLLAEKSSKEISYDPVKHDPFKEIDERVDHDRKLFNLSVKTNKESYKVGEPIYLIGIWQNNTVQDIAVKYPEYTFKFDTISIHDFARGGDYEFYYPNVSGYVPDQRDTIIKSGSTVEIKKDLTLSFIFRKGSYDINILISSLEGRQHPTHIKVEE